MLLLAAACVDDNDQRCPRLLTCSPTARFELAALPIDGVTRIAAATVEGCFNDECSEQRLYDVPRPADIRDVQASVDLGPRIAVELWIRGSPLALTGVVEIDSSPELLHDGDIYGISIVAADGTTVLDRRWEIFYQTAQPDGPSCGVCTSAATV